MSFQAEDILERLRQKQSTSIQSASYQSTVINEHMYDNHSQNESKVSLHDKLARNFSVFNQVISYYTDKLTTPLYISKSNLT